MWHRNQSDQSVQRFTVEGQPGLWIEGPAHTFTLFDAEGNPIEETTRLAANVLLWEANGVNHPRTAGLTEREVEVRCVHPGGCQTFSHGTRVGLLGRTPYTHP